MAGWSENVVHICERLPRRAGLVHIPALVAFFFSFSLRSGAEASFLRSSGQAALEHAFPGGSSLGRERPWHEPIWEHGDKIRDPLGAITDVIGDDIGRRTLDQEAKRKDGRMHQVKNIDESVEDFEIRQKPPFISIPGQASEEFTTEQQQKGVSNVFDQNPDDFKDCMLIHQYANLQVTDSFHLSDTEGDAWKLVGDGAEEEDVHIMVRPGAVYDSETGTGNEMHIGVNMFALLDGVTNPVQVLPVGAVVHYSSKIMVPLAGFLCMSQGESDSAPVLHALPTPCVPTVLDQVGNELDPTVDSFEVYIGTTHVTFHTKAEAERFCKGLGDQIARDMSTIYWDAERLQAVNIGGIVPQHDAGSGDTGIGQSSVTVTGNASAAKEKTTKAGAAAAANTSLIVRQTHEDGPPHDVDTPEEALARSWAFMAAGGKPGEQVQDPDKDVPVISPSLTKSPSLMNFCLQAAHKATPEGWTKGKKRLLVIVMDWKQGDDSVAPYSHQEANAVEQYKNKIFPVVQQKFKEMSYGQFEVEIDIVPEVIRYVRNRNQLTAKMPFPGLYEEARTSLQGSIKYGEKFLFRNYALTFVIHPQVAPVGTKGLAWVGSRGAICNGCETLSESMKIMVAVHELGHNLGLHHASSESLEYGNPFDFMGNYPDVVGLHYGLGYKYDLGWIRPDSLFEITDSTLGELNDMVTLTPYDASSAPSKGQVVGVKISLGSNKDDIFLSFRSSTIGRERGLYIVRQDKTYANSKLVDAGCHSISQQDAHMGNDWTYMDDSEQVVVKVIEEHSTFLKVHVYKRTRSPANIRARALFTDGMTKCPVTCQDSDLLISHTCKWFKDQGYCTHGAIKLQGRQLHISNEVCPVTCGKCEELKKTVPLEIGKAACADKNIKISGMNCPQIAQKQACESKTSSGQTIGQDLCPVSCNRCPSLSNTGSQADNSDPVPARQVGVPCPQECGKSVCQAGGAGNGGKALSGNSCAHSCTAPMGGARYCGSGPAYEGVGSVSCGGCSAPVCPAQCRAPSCDAGDASNGGMPLRGQACTNRCSPVYGGTRYCGAGSTYTVDGSIDCSSCWGASAAVLLQPLAAQVHTGQLQLAQVQASMPVCRDDESWRDVEGNSCEVYARSIKETDWGEKRVCTEHLGGVAAIHCRRTCGSCKSDGTDIEDKSPGCVDNACIGPWQAAYGRCYHCEDFPKGCKEPGYRAVFESECPVTCGMCRPAEEKKLVEVSAKNAHNCANDDDAWCKDLGLGYCSERDFASKCKAMCNLCSPPGTVVDGCLDMFSVFTCSRYKSYGWCTRNDTAASIQLKCSRTCGICGVLRTTRAPNYLADAANAASDPFRWLFGTRSGSVRQQGVSAISLAMTVLLVWALSA